MTTKFIGMKEFRDNMTKYSEQAKKRKIRYIIFKKNMPLFEVMPVNEEDLAYLKLTKELDEAERQIKNGEYFTHEEVKQSLGIK